MVATILLLFCGSSLAFDCSIDAENGKFLFKDLRIGRRGFLGLGTNLRGFFINDTERHWDHLTFTVISPKGKSRVAFIEVRPHQEIPITERIFDGRSDSHIDSDFKVKLESGKYLRDLAFQLVKPIQSDALFFQDDAIDVSITVDDATLNFIVKNKTDKVISVLWDQASYVDTLNIAHKVMHSEVKYIDRSLSQPPSAIPPNTKLIDRVTPVDNVVRSHTGGWRSVPLFSRESRLSDNLQGKTFGLLLPIEINGARMDYFFSFVISVN